VTTDDPTAEPTADPTPSTMDRLAPQHGPDRPPDPPRPVPSRRALSLVVAGIAVLFVCNQIGNVGGPDWVNDRPLLLLCLTGLLRWQILVVNQIDPVWVFVLVGGFRLLVADPLFYLLGYWYGDSAFTWIERRSPSVGAGARKLEQYFGYASWPLVVVMPNNPVCLLAGVHRMRPIVFGALNVVGTLGRLLLIIWLGQKLQDPIDDVLGFIREYRWYLIALSVPIVLLSSWRELARSVSEVGSLRGGRDDHGADGPEAPQ
jgi:membrane protein DedA with SNARE-associated domain